MAASSTPKGDKSESPNQEKKVKSGNGEINAEEDYGYSLYPGRDTSKDKGLLYKLKFRGQDNHTTCEENIQLCMNKSPWVKLLMGALKSYDCPVDLNRHISCEPCHESVGGGFDPQKMQVVICENMVTDPGMCCNVLAHELLHAFDFCRAKLDFKNLRHVACTEIRAANMNHCSLSASLGYGDASVFDMKQKHKSCVWNKALKTLLHMRNVTKQEAVAAIDDVFDRCYNDTEPYGRQCFKDINKAKRAYAESRNYYYYD